MCVRLLCRAPPVTGAIGGRARRGVRGGRVVGSTVRCGGSVGLGLGVLSAKSGEGCYGEYRPRGEGCCGQCALRVRGAVGSEVLGCAVLWAE